MWPPRRSLRNLVLALARSQRARAHSGDERVSYTQGQSPEPRTREYFYYVDHQGQVCAPGRRPRELRSRPRAGKGSRDEAQGSATCEPNSKAQAGSGKAPGPPVAPIPELRARDAGDGGRPASERASGAAALGACAVSVPP